MVLPVVLPVVIVTEEEGSLLGLTLPTVATAILLSSR